MPKKRTKKTDAEHHPDAPACAVEGCEAPGLYKAPQSPTKLNAYHYLCIDHIREYNKSWDFFSGMDQHQIEDFMKDAMTGHRPTWQIGSQAFYDRSVLEAALEQMLGGGRRAGTHGSTRQHHPDSRVHKALAVLDMEYPVTAKELKARYKFLVKQYHPDVNKGDKESEERFKRVTVAYKFLSEQIKTDNL